MIFIDTFEPRDIELLVSQVVPVTRMTLNHGPHGYADYLWLAHDGHRIQVERKQMDEILSDMDGVEELLSRELSNGVEETILLYEGTCEPIPGIHNCLQTWKLGKGGNVMIHGHKYQKSYKGLQAWFYQLDKAGVTVVHTPHYIATASALTAMYDSSQDPKHQTLQRYIKPHIQVASKNPHIMTLMGIQGVQLGEARAKALIDRYGTVWYVLTRTAEDLAETLIGEEGGKQKRLGIVTAKKLLESVGVPQ